MNKTVELVASADNKSEYINVRDKIDENTNELVLRIPLGSIESRINWAQSHEYMVTKPDKAKNRSGGNLTMYQWSKNIAGITFKMSGYIPYKDGVDSWEADKAKISASKVQNVALEAVPNKGTGTLFEFSVKVKQGSCPLV